MRCDARLATILVLEGLLSDRSALLFDHEQRRSDVSHEFPVHVDELVDLEASHSSTRMLVGVVNLLRIDREAVGPESSAKPILE